MAKAKKKKEKTHKEPEHKEVIQAQHKFTEKEQVDISQELCREIQRHGELESQLKHVQSDFKSKMKGIQSHIDELSNKINSGYEFRPLEVKVEFFPKEGTKKYFHPKSGELIRSEAMTPSDFQLTLPVPEPKKKEKEEAPLNPVINDEEAEEIEKVIGE